MGRAVWGRITTAAVAKKRHELLLLIKWLKIDSSKLSATCDKSASLGRPRFSAECRDANIHFHRECVLLCGIRWSLNTACGMSFALVKAKRPLHRLEIMDSFSPELAQHWLASQSSKADDVVDRRADESLTPSQQAALDALADRISAARSVY